MVAQGKTVHRDDAGRLLRGPTVLGASKTYEPAGLMRTGFHLAPDLVCQFLNLVGLPDHAE